MREFDKPILWLQGDKHHWSLDPEYFGTAPNLTRVILERTGPGDPLLVSVTDDPDDPFDSDHSFGGQFL